MDTPTWRRLIRGATIRRDAQEAKDALGRYLREETVAPLVAVARFAAFGLLGSILVGFGLLMLLIGLLRFLQSFSVMNGSLSWIPYLAVAVAAIAVLAITVWRIVADSSVRRRLKDDAS